MREIRFYCLESGRSPIEEFLDGLSSKQAQKVVWVLRLVEELPVVPVQYLKKLVGSEGIWEVRVQVDGNIFRLLGFFDEADRELVILNHAFQKKTQKTPAKEIRSAEQRKRDYFARKG